MNKRLQKNFIILLPIIALIMEIIPYGVKLVFSDGPENNFKKYVYTYSFFHLMPLAYGNWGPLITGILTVAIIILAVIWIIRKKNKWPKSIIVLSILAFCTSLWIFIFKEAYTWVSWIISFLLIAEVPVGIIIGKQIND